MKILLLEDNPNRIDWFLRKFYGDDVYVTDDPVRANRYIDSIEFDEIWLDHD